MRFSHIAMLAIAFAGIPAGATAQTLFFDDITTGNDAMIPNGYGGFNWFNFGVVNKNNYAGTGYEYGNISPDYNTYNNNGQPAQISSSTLFDFNSAYLTAAWTDGKAFRVTGFRGAAQVYQQVLALSRTTPALVKFDYLQVDLVRFETADGSSDWFTMDNATFNAAPTTVPEPMSLTLLGTGLFGIAGAVRSRRRRHFLESTATHC